MNLEGSRHERALLTVVAYVIGFVTAYIAFGAVKDMPIDPVYQTASVVNTVMVGEGPMVTDVVYNKGFYAIVDGKPKPISASNVYGEGMGFHVDITSYNISADGSTVDFCSVEYVDQSCINYRYHADSHTVERL